MTYVIVTVVMRGHFPASDDFAYRDIVSRARRAEEIARRETSFGAIKDALIESGGIFTHTQSVDRTTVKASIAGENSDMITAWLRELQLPTNVQSLWLRARAEMARRHPASSAPETDQKSMQGRIDDGLDTWNPPAVRLPHFHAGVLLALKVLRPLWGASLRLFHERTVHLGHTRPDFALTAAREGTVTGTNTLLFIEVKHPSNKISGEAQLQRYLTRRLLQLVIDTHKSGMALEELSRLQAVGCVTTLDSVMVMRLCVRMAAATPSDGPEKPALLRMSTPWLPLLPADTGVEPTTGFEALCRLLATSPQQLGERCPVPVRVALPGSRGDVEVVAHLGTGGFGTAYSAHVGGLHVVVKQPRHGDARSSAALTQERDVIHDLPPSPHLPRLVPGLNDPSSRDAPASLVLEPVGKPVLCVRDDMGESPSSAGLSALAHHVTRDIMRALHAAHRVGITHGDVRFSNVVAAGGCYVLVDWGHAQRRGGRTRGDFAALCVQDLCDAIKVGLVLQRGAPQAMLPASGPIGTHLVRLEGSVKRGIETDANYELPDGLFDDILDDD